MAPRERLQNYSFPGADSSFAKTITGLGFPTCLAGTLIKLERGPVNRQIKQAGDKRLGDVEGDRKQLPTQKTCCIADPSA